jgi:hypothetical protein
MMSTVHTSSQVGSECYFLENSRLNRALLLGVFVGMVLPGKLQPLVGTQKQEQARNYIEVFVTDGATISSTTEP